MLPFIGIVERDEDLVRAIMKTVPSDAVVLEIGSGDGRCTSPMWLAVEPNGILVRCHMLNNELRGIKQVILNACITERQMIISGNVLKESNGNHHESDVIRTIPLKDVQETSGLVFNYIVAHRKDYFEEFEKDYPEFVTSCTLLKTYELL